MSRNLSATIFFLILGAILVLWPFVTVGWLYYKNNAQAWSHFYGPLPIFLAFHMVAGACCIALCFLPQMRGATALMLVISALAWMAQDIPINVTSIDKFVLAALCISGTFVLITSVLVPHEEDQDDEFDVEKPLPSPESDVVDPPLPVSSEKRSVVETPAPNEAEVAETELEHIPIESKK